jgi:hypothetical protein
VLGTICVNNSFLRFVAFKSNLLVFFLSQLGSKRESQGTHEDHQSHGRPSKGADVIFLTLQLLPTSTSARMPSILSKANFHE